MITLENLIDFIQKILSGALTDWQVDYRKTSLYCENKSLSIWFNLKQTPRKWFKRQKGRLEVIITYTDDYNKDYTSELIFNLPNKIYKDLSACFEEKHLDDAIFAESAFKLAVDIQ